MTKCMRNFALLMAFAMVTSLPAVAQQAALTGTVSDPTGAVIPGAAIKLIDKGTGAIRTTTSGASGGYRLAQLEPGQYRLEISMVGFKTQVQDPVTLAVGTSSTANVTLEVGAIAQSVEVESTVVGLNTSDASLGTAFSADEVSNLPSLDANPVGLLSLQAGVTYVPAKTDGIGGYSGTNIDDHRGGSVSGARSDQTNVTLDGVDVNDPITGAAFQSVLRVTQDALQEFRVSTTNYSSEGGGRSSAAQVSLVTKSGTNKPHGSTYYLHRNEAFNANDFFLNRDGVKKEKFRRHLYGASLGGPVVKDRFFLFGNWERMEESIFEGAERSVPSMHFRDGVFIYSCTTSAGFPACPAGATQVAGLSGALHDVPAGHYGLTPAEITAIDGMGIGPNAASLAQWAIYPEPNAPGDQDGINLLGFRFAAPVSNTFNAYVLRGDFNIDRAAKHTLFWRGSLQHDTLNSAPAFPGEDAIKQIRVANKGMALGYTAVFSPTLVNNFRWGLTRIKDQTSGLRTNEFVWHRFLFDPFGFTDTPGGSANSSLGRTVPQQHFRNDFSWIRGSHSFTFGGEARYTRNRRFDDTLSFNTFTVNPSWLPDNGNEVVPGHVGCIAAGCTAVPVSTFGRHRDIMTTMLGPISAITARFNFNAAGDTLTPGEAVSRRYAVDEYEFYAQDVWRVTPTITLNLGLRYFIASPPWEQDGQQVVPNPGMSEWFGCRQEAMLAGLPSLDTCGLVEMVLGGKANNAPGFYDWDKNNFSPRIGLAWAPRSLGWFSGNGKMTIRVGYSLVYDRIGNALAVSFDQRGAFGMSTSISDSLGSCAIFSERGRPPCARFTGHGDTAAAGATLDQFGNPLLAVSPGGGFPTTPPFPLISVTGTIDDGLRTPYSHAATLSIARELPGNLIVEAAYVGRRGINLPIQRDFAMGADLRASGTTAFQASRDLIQLAAQGQDILTLGPIPFWENLFPGFGPTGVNGGCLPWDVFGVDPAGNCGFSTTQVAFDNMLGWHGTLGPGGVANPGFGAISFFLDDVDFSGLPSYATCPNGTDVDNDGLPDCPFTFFPGQWVALNGWTGLARSEYHALQVSVRKRMSHGLLFNINYTFSHSLDHASIPERTDTGGGSEIGAGPSGLMNNAWELDQQYGDSDFDMRHQLNAHWAYELPIGPGRAWGSGISGWANQIVGGFAISGIFRAQSGLPLSVSNGRTWPTNWNVAPFGTCAPVGSHPLGLATGPCPAAQNVSNGPRGPNMFADPDAAFLNFRHTAPGDTGNRNPMSGDNYINIDLGIAKEFSMPWEGHRFVFRWDIFNLFNSAYFDSGQISASLTSPGTFGDYQEVLGRERLMQVTLRYVF